MLTKISLPSVVSGEPSVVCVKATEPKGKELSFGPPFRPLDREIVFREINMKP